MRNKLLLVDDESRNLALLEAQLAPFDFDIATASDGREALRSIAERRPDLVLLDLAMPGLDGVDVLMHMRSAGEPHIPVIVVTAHSEREHRLRALEAGADEFLEKPIDRALLHARVRTLLALKTSRDQLAARHADLQALQREQRELMQFLIHDIRTPLMVARSGVAFAEANLEAEPRESIEALQDTSVSIDRICDLVNDMLIVARLEQPDPPIDRSMLNVDALLARIVRAYGRRAAAQELEIEAHAAEIMIHADARLLQRVLENILDNSLRHTPSRGRVSLRASRATDDAITIAVSNSGPPIPMEERESLFGKFARGQSPGSSPGSLGIGLYFCRRAVEAHGGRIRIEQSAEWPTSFVIDLPVN